MQFLLFRRLGRHLVLSPNIKVNLYKIYSSSSCCQFQRANSTNVVTSIWTTLSNSPPVMYAQSGLIQLHDFTGLPWWGNVILSTVILRTVVTLPLSIYQQRNMARFEKVATVDLPELTKEIKIEMAIAVKKFGWTEEEARAVFNKSLKKQYQNLIIKENCHPAKSFVILWGQIPLWVTQSMALRNLVQMLPNPTDITAQIAYTELTIGGFLWIPNLTEVDSSYILPVALGLLNLTIIEFQNIIRVRPPGKLQKVMINFFRGLSVLMIPVACTVPSCLSLYWVTSSAYGLAQNLLLMSPKFKRLVGIPKTPTQVENPYQRIYQYLLRKKEPHRKQTNN